MDPLVISFSLCCRQQYTSSVGRQLLLSLSSACCLEGGQRGRGDGGGG